MKVKRLLATVSLVIASALVTIGAAGCSNPTTTEWSNEVLNRQAGTIRIGVGSGIILTQNEVKAINAQIAALTSSQLAEFGEYVNSWTRAVGSGGMAFDPETGKVDIVSNGSGTLLEDLEAARDQAIKERPEPEPEVIHTTFGTIPVTSTELFTWVEIGRIMNILNDLNEEYFEGFVAGIRLVRDPDQESVTLNSDNKAEVVTTIDNLRANLTDGRNQSQQVLDPDFIRVDTRWGVDFYIRKGLNADAFRDALDEIDFPAGAAALISSFTRTVTGGLDIRIENGRAVIRSDEDDDRIRDNLVEGARKALDSILARNLTSQKTL